jgi:uncharacterized protein (DUF1697 family)
VRTLKTLDASNIGATGIFVIRKGINKSALRSRLTRSLPFNTDIFIVPGREITRLLSADPFRGRATPRGTVKFVSILSRRTHPGPRTTFSLPTGKRWLVRILGRRGRFVYGLYRRNMKVIGILGQLDTIFGVPLTTRSWGTIEKIGVALRTS